MGNGYALVNIDDVEDIAATHGMDMGESRYLGDNVGAETIGASFYRMAPGKRMGFGHAHGEMEELYVVLEGSGRIKVGEEILDLTPLDAIRVAPPVMRELEAGQDGLTLIAFGTHKEGDSTMDRDFWPAS